MVFGQKARPNTEVWKLLNSQGVVDEEDLPSEIINQLSECGDLTNVKDPSTADENKPSISQIQPLQPPPPASPVRGLQHQPAPLSPVYVTPPINKRRRTRLTSKSKTAAKTSKRMLQLIIYLDDYVVVSFDEQSDNDDSSPVNTNHNQIRSEAEASYMATIAKRQKLFNDAQNGNNYKIGDLVGLKIDRVDRTNVTPKILPCKIISIKSTSDNVNTYELCTTTCIISSWIQAIDLLNLTKCNFRDLRDVDPTGLPNMTFIQACKEYVKLSLITPTKACNCNGNCSTKKCSCRAAKVPCSTKCHSMKRKSCSNA